MCGTRSEPPEDFSGGFFMVCQAGKIEDIGHSDRTQPQREIAVVWALGPSFKEFQSG